MNERIYIADDEKNIRDLIEAFLKREGYETEAFANGELLISACIERMPDLVVLDIMMPGTDGLAVCRALREVSPLLPIIIVSAKDSPFDRVTGLTMGSDDYLVKPFLPIELVARVKALLRRSKPQTMAQNLTFGPLFLSSSRREAILSGHELLLTPTEFDFLFYLASHSDQAVSRAELMREVWKTPSDIDTRAADDLVKRLRKKLREAGGGVGIETVRSYGFRISPDEACDEK